MLELVLALVFIGLFTAWVVIPRSDDDKDFWV